jgi:hypothetical protein
MPAADPAGPLHAELLGFTNRSADIRELFARVCDSVGVECRPLATA